MVPPKSKKSSFSHSGSSTRHTSMASVQYSPYLSSLDHGHGKAGDAARKLDYGVLASVAAADDDYDAIEAGELLDSAFTACSTTVSPVASPSRSSASASSPKMMRSSVRLSSKIRSKPTSSSTPAHITNDLPPVVAVPVEVEAAVASMTLDDTITGDDAIPAGFSVVPRELPPPPDRSSIHYPGFDVHYDTHLLVAPPCDMVSSPSRAETGQSDSDADKENTVVTPRRRIKKAVKMVPSIKSKAAAVKGSSAESDGQKMAFVIKSVPSTPRKGLCANANAVAVVPKTPTRRSPRLNASKASPSRSATKRATGTAADGENDWLPEPVTKRRRRAVSVLSDEMNVE